MEEINQSKINTKDKSEKLLNDLIKKFQSNLFQLCYKPDNKFIKNEYENIFDNANSIKNDKFCELFEFLIGITHEKNTLTKNDRKLLENINLNTSVKLKEEEEFSFDNLETEEKLLENEIHLLEREIENLDNEIEDENLFYEIEKEEEKELSEGLEKSTARLAEIQKTFNDQISIFEKKNLNQFLSKLSNLNKNSFNILSELNFNLENVNNSNKIIIGLKKFENSKWEELIKDIDLLLQNLEIEIKENCFRKNLNLSNTKNDLQYEEFEINLSKFNQIKGMYSYLFFYFSKQELERNKILSTFNYKKQSYLNEMINNYIKNDKEIIEHKLKADSSENLSISRNFKERFNSFIEIKNLAVETQYERLKSYFNNMLYDQVISRRNYAEIEINKKLINLQKIICSLAPFLTLDQDTTQAIYNNLFELTEKYNNHHSILANSQTFLRKKLNENKIENKRTIDERDVINITIARFLENKKSKKISDEFAVYELTEYHKRLLRYKLNMKEQTQQITKDVFYSINSELLEKLKIFYALLRNMKLDNSSCIENSLEESFQIGKNSAKYSFKITKLDIFSIFKNYLDIMQNN